MTTGTAGAIITKAYQDAGLVSRLQTPSTAQFADGIDRLNDIINLEATQGLKLWLQQDVSCPLVAGQATYTFGPGGSVSMTKPLSVLQGYYLYASGVRQPLTALSRDEYTRLSQVNINGSLSSYFTDKRATMLAVSVWNPPDATAALGTFHPIMRVAAGNVTVTADSAGFPPEWVLFLRWALADDLATGQPKEVQDRCESRMQGYRDVLQSFDVEDAATFFVPDERTQYGSNEFI